MYKTGDINQNLARLKIELKKIKYPVENFESENVSNGNPVFFLPIIHYAVLDYSKHIAKILVDNNYELFSKSDQEFVTKAFKALTDLFNFRPNITIKQFFSFGYAEAKIILCLEIIRIIKGEHNNSVKKVYSTKPPINKNKKINDSFRSAKNIDMENYVDYLSNYSEKGKIQPIVEQKMNHNKISNNYEEIEEDFPNATSPKFNETPHSMKKNYNFDIKILKRNNKDIIDEKRNLQNDDENSHRDFDKILLKKNKSEIKNSNFEKFNAVHATNQVNTGKYNRINEMPENDQENEFINYENNETNKLYNMRKNVDNKDPNDNNSNRYKEYDLLHKENDSTYLNLLDENEQREDYIINYKEHPHFKNKSRHLQTNDKFVNYNQTKDYTDISNVNQDYIHKDIGHKTKEKQTQPISRQIGQDQNLEEQNHQNNFNDVSPKNYENTSIKNQNKNNLIEFSSLIEIINSLANSIKEMTNKVDSFKTSIERRVEKIEAELTLIKNRQSIIESKNFQNSQNNHTPVSTINNRIANPVYITQEIKENLNTNEENEHIFSFADDHNVHSHNQLVNKLETIYEDKDVKTYSSDKNKNPTSMVDNNTHLNSKNKNKITKESNTTNKFPNKILNDIEDTDTIIQRIANRFKETQKLLNEFK